MDTFTVIASVGGALGGIGAIGAWFAALQSRNTSRTIAAIEAARRHRELRPRFHITCTNMGNDYATLDVKLIGPDDLDRLDSVTVAIRDDKPRKPSGLAGSPSADEIARVVWGPWRFRPNVDGADELGRVVEPVTLELGDGTRFALDPSLAPKWYADLEAWRNDYKKKPLRLRLTCVRDGQPEWAIPVEVEVTKPQKLIVG